MTLKSAIDSIAKSRSNDACKRIGMGGYLFRGPVSDDSGSEGDFTLTFRKRENDGSGNPVDFTFQYNSGTGKWTAPQVRPDLTGELFRDFLGDDWMIGKKDDFESARVPDPGDEW